jgi:hypothetical protein
MPSSFGFQLSHRYFQKINLPRQGPNIKFSKGRRDDPDAKKRCCDVGEAAGTIPRANRQVGNRPAFEKLEPNLGAGASEKPARPHRF